MQTFFDFSLHFVSLLLQPLVVAIMSYLDNPSRLKMALTCKSWAKLIKSASLWRNLDIELSAFRTVDKPIIQYAKVSQKLHYLL